MTCVRQIALLACLSVILVACNKDGNPVFPVNSVTGLSLSPAIASAVVGESVQFIATVTGVGNFDRTVKWRSSNEAVATVDADGKVTCAAPGTAAISAFVSDGGDFIKTSTITCSAKSAEVTGVAVTPANSVVMSGSSVQLTATVISTGMVSDMSVTWTSSDPALAAVDDQGNVTTKGVGTVTIVARSKAAPAVSGTAQVTIVPIDISPFLGTFNINATKLKDTGCNFSPIFSGQLQVSGQTDGNQILFRLTEKLVRDYLGTLKSNGTFDATGSGNLGGFQYAGQVSGLILGNTVTGTETMNFTTGCPGSQVVYQFTGTR